MSNIVFNKLLFDPVDPIKVLEAVYTIEERVISIRDGKGLVCSLFCPGTESFLGTIETYAKDHALLLYEPRYELPTRTVLWQILDQKDNDLVVEYTVGGESHKTKLTVPGISKGIEIDTLRTIVSTALKSDMKKKRLVGIAGTFKEENVEEIVVKKEVVKEEEDV